MKKFTASLAAACVALFGIGTSVSAASGTESVNAILNNKLTFQVNGESWTPSAAPISYNNTTYLPVRAVSTALGLDIKYEAASSSIIILTGKGGAGALSGSSNTGANATASKPIKALLNYNLKFQIEGENWTPSATPISYNNTTYLPVRAISNALGIDIKYNAANSSIAIVNETSSSDNAAASKTLPLFDSHYESGGYELHTGQSNKLAYAGKSFKKVMYADDHYHNFYVYPEGKYATLVLQMASSQAAIIDFTDPDGKLLKSVEIPKGVIAPVPLDVKGITGDKYVTVSVKPTYSNLTGEMYVFDTSAYTNTPANDIALLPVIPDKLPLFESQYEAGGYTLHASESDKLTYDGKTYKMVMYSEDSYQNFYVYPKGKFSTFVLDIASTEDANIIFKSDKDEVLKTVTITKGSPTAVQFDVSKISGEHYITVYVTPAIDDFEGSIYVFDTSHYIK